MATNQYTELALNFCLVEEEKHLSTASKDPQQVLPFSESCFALVVHRTFSILKSWLSFALPTVLVTTTSARLAWAHSKDWNCLPTVFSSNYSQRGTFLSNILRPISFQFCVHWISSHNTIPCIEQMLSNPISINAGNQNLLVLSFGGNPYRITLCFVIFEKYGWFPRRLSK